MTARLVPVRSTLVLGAVLAGTVLAAGCGSSSGSDADVEGAAKLAVVASTNVYGNIAETIGGDDVAVTSILSNPDQDPHSFEASPRTALAISKADLLIENGGGYDDYMTTLRSSTRSKAPVIDVVELSGKKAPAGGELNEHVWYDFASMKLLADDLAEQLGRADPDDADAFTSRAASFETRLDDLIAKETRAKRSGRGKAIGITEPVPLYLTEALGLTNKTPEKFSEAVEEGDDVSAPVLQQTLDLYRDKQVAALVYNSQTSGPITAQVADAAEAAGIPVVPVTETLPKGTTYLSWMRDNLDAITTAVSRHDSVVPQPSTVR